ncbi:type I methionyl aminopeptidase [Alicyclobacillus tolerans]|uniref:type I methionyl aminopeptidase n=1 Tax=Alicyclobacillus tolerans TaxID=90970 RepID=UPI001F028AFD|nr:type I methionyl aminopeptidase [Alicyclobacillus tolerans]MCF8565007.1 type I methionyl aminopeptidase [Alicyclobacillus tolerans]
MIPIRTEAEIELIRQCGRINAVIHERIRDALQAGISTQELNDLAEEAMLELGVKSSIRDPIGFPGDICISVNDEVGHGVPGRRILQDGDVVKIDISVERAGYHTDCAKTHIVGNGSVHAQRLVSLTHEALREAISRAQAGRRCSDISFAVEQMVQAHGCSVVRHAFGHGIGTDLHEPPLIANFGPPNRGPRLRPGMVVAIEPVVSSGSRFTRKLPNGWTDVTVDGSPGAHFEHTVLITDGEPEVLTQLQDGKTDAGRGDNSAVDVASSAVFAIPDSSSTVSAGIVFREMGDVDRPALLQLAAREMDPILIEAWGRKMDPREVFEPGTQTVVLQHESEGIVGFFTFCELNNALHLNTIVIQKGFQGHGLGKQVMRKLEQLAHNRSLSGMSLCVQTNNQRAVQFYERLGYRVSGTVYVNTCWMEKGLTPR